MAKLWHTKRALSSVTATDAQVGYGASNLLVEELAIEWRSVDLGAKTVDFILPAPASVELVYLHGVNFAAATVKYSTDGAAFSGGQAYAAYSDWHGRYRGPLVLAQPVVKTVRLEIQAGNSTDGASFWRVGALYLMASRTDVLGPEWGYQIGHVDPQVEAELANKRRAVAGSGTAFDEIALSHKRRDGEDVASVLQKTRAGTCIWTTDIASTPEEIWPVRRVESRVNRSRENLKQTGIQIILRERV